ncbi:MAG: site-2 protease family protein [Pirellulaceae bacterium]|nr:site-2 protease family protein [Pirellulaceae bacterium]
MFRSWRLGRLFSIETYIHWSFWLLIVWVLLSVSSEGGLAKGLSACGFLIAVFLCVYLHELGHAFAARYYGIRTIDITMLPIGGLARLERIPENAWQELWISLAGPAVNVVIALALGSGAFLRGELADLRGVDIFGQTFLEQIVFVNVALAVFNMFPALPMDGGRVLRSLLQLRMPRLQATEIAARVSRYLALFLIAVGIFKSFSLVLIGLFVLIAGFQELMAVRLQAWRESGGAAGGPFPGGNGVWFQSNVQFGSSPSSQPIETTRDSTLHQNGDTLDAEDVKRIE